MRNGQEATRLRVLKVINVVGYSPNPFAQTMRTGQSRTAGLAVSRITSRMCLKPSKPQPKTLPHLNVVYSSGTPPQKVKTG